MEPLYPQNILERHYPILRERREREEREQIEEESAAKVDGFLFDEPREAVLYENEPQLSGPVGRTLNTIA